MVHKPKHKVHSFRGLLGDGGQDEIVLERSNANLAYRIVKFQALGQDSNSSYENVTKIYREDQSTPGIDGDINFTDTDLLAALIYQQHSVGQTYPLDAIVIFDNILFSRNIYVTCKNAEGSGPINYYIELEEVPVTASTLMQIKLGTARRNIGAKMGG